MTFELTPYVTINAAATFIAFLAALFALQRGSRKGKHLAAMLLAGGIWTGGAALELATIGIPGQIFWAKVQYFGALSCPVLFLTYTLEHLQMGAWLTRRNLFLLFLIPLLTTLLAFTNEWHNWIWTGFTPSPAGNNITIFSHGIAYWLFGIGYSYLLMLAGTSLLIRSIFKFPSSSRSQAILVLTGASAPWIFNGIYISGLSPFPGLEVTPLIMVFSGVILDWAIVDDLINGLRQEIKKREKLEQDLRRSEEALLLRLNTHSARLSGLYGLILASDSSTDAADGLKTPLEKIAAILNCQSICYFSLDGEHRLVLDACLGAGFKLEQGHQPFPSGWLLPGAEPRAILFKDSPPDLPAELHLDGQKAAIFKWVMLQNQPLGVLAAYWSGQSAFAVEEVALFSALSDGLGLLMENTRLRHGAASRAVAGERRRMARDLHDSVTQSLLSMGLSIQSALEDSADAARMGQILTRLDGSVRQALKETRLLLYELRLEPSGETGLASRLAQRLEAVEGRAGIRARLNILPDAAWPREWEAQLYPIAIEALNNALKHARASSVEVQISGAGPGFQMEVRDNGAGFNPASIPPGGMGLLNMAERCEALGADFEISAAPGAGTTIRVSMPKKASHMHTGPREGPAHG